MTLLAAAIIDAVSTDADALRRVYKLLALGSSGVTNDTDLKVTAGSGMQSVIAAGDALVLGTQNTATQGAYGVKNDASVTQTHSTADPTNPRNDLVIVQVRDAFYSGANKDVIPAIVTGTPAPSPADPTPPANALVLARVRVNAGASSLGTITDLRPRIGVPYHAEVVQGSSQTIPSGTPTIIAFDAITADPNGNFTTGASAHYTIPVTGRYLVVARFGYNGAVAGSTIYAYLNGVQVLDGDQPNTSRFVCQLSGVVRATVAGQALDIRAIQTSGSPAANNAPVYASFTYLGPL